SGEVDRAVETGSCDGRLAGALAECGGGGDEAGGRDRDGECDDEAFHRYLLRSVTKPNTPSVRKGFRRRLSAAMSRVLPAEGGLRRVIGDGGSIPDGEVDGLGADQLLALYRDLV